MAPPPYAMPHTGPGYPGVRGATDPTDMTLPLYSATFKVATRRFLKGYAQFRGRASQSEFWWAYLFMCLVTSVPILVGAVFYSAAIIMGVFEADKDVPAGAITMIIIAVVFYGVGFLASLGLLVPQLAVGWRRLQDANMNGALVLISLVVGFWFLVIGFLPTKPEGQRFDPGAPQLYWPAPGYPPPPPGYGPPPGPPPSYGPPPGYGPPPQA